MGKNRAAFSLFEILVVCALLSTLFFWLLRTPQRLHDQFLRVAATQLQLTLTQQCERARTNQTALPITLPTLPLQVRFGAPAGALGPPSKQTKPITQAITCAHEKNEMGYTITASAAGTLPPGTIYLTNEGGGDGYALSSTGNSSCPVRCYRWMSGRWRLS